MDIWVILLSITIITIAGVLSFFYFRKGAEEPLTIEELSPFLKEVLLQYPDLSIVDSFSLRGEWEGRPIEIRFEEGPYEASVLIEIASSYNGDLSFILTPQPELFGLLGEKNDFDVFFSILQFPAEILDRLLDLDVVIVYKWIEAWLMIDPDYPMACFHKFENQRQTVKLFGDYSTEGVAIAINMMAHTAGVLEKLELND